MKLATAAQMRELDKRAIRDGNIPSIDLMERAAAGVAEAVLSLLLEWPGKCRAAVLCGNGGDGIAAWLLFLAGGAGAGLSGGSYENLTPDALEQTRRLSACGVELEVFDPEDEGQRAWVLWCHVLVDNLFGVGLSRDIDPASPYAA